MKSLLFLLKLYLINIATSFIVFNSSTYFLMLLATLAHSNAVKFCPFQLVYVYPSLLNVIETE